MILHPLITEEYRKANPTPYLDQIKWANRVINKSLKKKNMKIDYDLENATKVVFFKNIKKTSTAPKINIIDSFNQKWKLKWGFENQPEVIANRLYLLLGAKFSDINFSMKRGLEGTVLILQKEDKGCKQIATVSNLKKCLLKSKYKFNLEPYLFSEGIITKKNSSLIQFQKENLIGREFVSFTSAQLEVKSKSLFTRSGAFSSSNLGAKKDRAIRGSALFHMWIGSYDVKEANSKGVLLKEYRGKKKQYLEFYHDLGGSIGKSGELEILIL